MPALSNTLDFILRHPLNRGTPLAALGRYLRWQVGSRLVPGAVAVPYVAGTRLLVARGMTGATGNVYCGLHEFEDMGLVLHALRPNDLFVDIGANVGAYTVLAAGARGASVLAVEPVPATFGHLVDNVRLNRLEALVTARNVGVGAAQGRVAFTASLDTVNHVVAGPEAGTGEVVQVPLETLDGLLRGLSPALMKIDVEGYETEVVRGGRDALAGAGLLAVLLELNGSGRRYGFDEDRLHGELLEKGFRPSAYDPWSRELRSLPDRPGASGNTLYVRDFEALRERLKTAPKYRIHGRLV
jgi:FkbM family methyltransferase